MQDEILKDFFLVGGTALALQLGHRISIDLDLFSKNSFDRANMLSALENKYSFQLAYEASNTLKGEIAGVQVDLITHNYPLVKPLIETEGVRMATPDDIAAMKLNAISGDGNCTLALVKTHTKKIVQNIFHRFEGQRFLQFFMSRLPSENSLQTENNVRRKITFNAHRPNHRFFGSRLSWCLCPCYHDQGNFKSPVRNSSSTRRFGFEYHLVRHCSISQFFIETQGKYF